MSPHCRIGRVRLKGGADLRIFRGSVPERNVAVLSKFDQSVDWLREDYNIEIGGFVLMCFDRSRNYTIYVHSDCEPCRNTLPEFTAEALRRNNAKHEVYEIMSRS
nr:hypothetical protein [uncultured archaeon]